MEERMDMKPQKPIRKGGKRKISQGTIGIIHKAYTVHFCDEIREVESSRRYRRLFRGGGGEVERRGRLFTLSSRNDRRLKQGASSASPGLSGSEHQPLCRTKSGTLTTIGEVGGGLLICTAVGDAGSERHEFV